MMPVKRDNMLTMYTGPNTSLNSGNVEGKNLKFWSYVLNNITFIYSMCVQPFHGKEPYLSLWAGSWVTCGKMISGIILILCNFIVHIYS
jgi:hypothetical protein